MKAIPMPRFLLLIVFLMVFVGPTFARGELVAERITAENFAKRHVGGPDADGGIDDWFIGNGTLCAVISDPGHESPLTPWGGVLIDLGHCDANDDQWSVYQPLLNLDPKHVLEGIVIEAGVETNRAWIRTRGVVHGIEIATTYSVDETNPTVLDVSLRAKRVGEGDGLFGIGSLVLHPTGQTPAFSLLRSDLARSLGFVYPATDRRSALSLLRGLAASDLTVLVGGDEMPPISYGVERRSTELESAEGSRPLASFSVTGLHYTVINTLTSPLWFENPDAAPGILQLVQIPFMDIVSGTEFAADSRIWIGPRADVASITDQIWPDATRLQGSVSDPTARIHIDHVSGAPVTEIRPDEDGRFTVRLPAGRYRARVVAPADRSMAVAFEVDAKKPTQVLPRFELGQPGTVRVSPEFIGRLVFINEDGSGPARFGRDLLGFRIGDYLAPSGLDAPFANLADPSPEPRHLALAPGHYRVVAVRGPEYEARETKIEIRAGEETKLDLRPLARVARTPDWIAADLHVHSGESFDSSLPQTKQIAAFAASGAEVLVATEHDRIFDPRPAILRSGLGDQLVSITGVEMTSAFEGNDSPFTTGHLNAFPMKPQPSQYRGGAPRLEGRRLRDALADLRATEAPPFVQMNHPRPGPGESGDDTYFSHIGALGLPFDPKIAISIAPNDVLIERNPSGGGRDLDYHGVELMNGQSLTRYRRVRADWLSLLLQGERIVATANSDSHRLGAIVGLPRTYVRVPSDRLDSFKEGPFMDSLRSGRAYGSTGPLLDVRLDDAGLGDMHAGSQGTLRVRVDAAPWVPIAEWRAYVNGELVFRAPIRAGEEASLPLAFERDAFVTVEVEGPATGLYRDALPDFIPFSFTNPIFVDADRNGHFEAPGLPGVLPPTLADPDRID